MALRRRGAHRRSARSKIDATVPWEEPEKQPAQETSGPWDLADAPEDDLERLDVGALRIPLSKGVDMRFEANAEGAVASVIISHAGSQMQIGVFAAPRTSGIWDEVRKELLGSIASQGGTGQETRGRFGKEITGRVAVQGGHQPARFVGVDGPRWFLRAVITGPAASDEAKAGMLEDTLGNVVVVRDAAPMPVKEPLPMQLPKDLAERAAEQHAQRQQQARNARRPNK